MELPQIVTDVVQFYLVGGDKVASFPGLHAQLLSLPGNEARDYGCSRLALWHACMLLSLYTSMFEARTSQIFIQPVIRSVIGISHQPHQLSVIGLSANLLSLVCTVCTSLACVLP